MKKIKYLLLILTFYMAMPLNVFADCGIGPLEVEATIANPNGAKIYEKDKEYNSDYLKKGTKVIVEYIFDGYATIKVDDTYIGSVKVEDLDFSKKIGDKEDSRIFYTYEDTKLMDRPSTTGYNVLDTIPKGTDILVYDVKNGSGYGTVNYNGKVGYVYIAYCNPESSVTLFDKEYIKNEEKHTLYKDVKYGYKVIGDEKTKTEVNLKAKESIKVKYSFWIGHSSYSYIATDNIDGIWIVDALLIEEKNDFVLKIADKEEYEENAYIEDFNTTKSVNVNFDEEFYDIEYFITGTEDDGYVINKNGKLYAIYGSYCNIGEVFYKNKETIQLDKEYEYYKNIFVYNNTIGTLKEGTYEAYKYYNMYDYNTDNICNYYIPEYGYIMYSGKIVSNTDTTTNNNLDNNKSISASAKNYVLYVVLGTLGVSLVAASLIFLINKNKKEITNESK